MSTPAMLRQLCALFAELYPDRASAIRVAEDAGIPIALVALNDRALDNWHAILQEAVKQDRLALLLAVVNEEYAANPRLRAVMLQLQGWPALFATLAVMGQQQLTLHRVWLGAILVVVLAIVVVWVNLQLTVANEQPTPSPTAIITVAAPTPTPQPSPASFTYGVTVRDPEGQPIANAHVLIELEDGKSPQDGYTDSNGYARIFVPTVLAERPGRLVIEVDGSVVETQHVDLWLDQLPKEIRLPRK